MLLMNCHPDLGCQELSITFTQHRHFPEEKVNLTRGEIDRSLRSDSLKGGGGGGLQRFFVRSDPSPAFLPSFPFRAKPPSGLLASFCHVLFPAALELLLLLVLIQCQLGPNIRGCDCGSSYTASLSLVLISLVTAFQVVTQV